MCFGWDCFNIIDSSLDFEVSLLRLIDKATNGTVIEISYTGAYMCSVRLCYDVWHLKRHIVTTSTRDSHRWISHPWMPTIAICGIFLRANHYDRTILEKTSESDTEGSYNGWQGPFCESVGVLAKRTNIKLLVFMFPGRSNTNGHSTSSPTVRHLRRSRTAGMHFLQSPTGWEILT